jgi:O-antigen/teichoic acid export membrane protein
VSRTLIKDSTIYGLGTLLTRSLRLILLPLYTRYLSVADYGALSLLNLILEIVSYFCMLGVGVAATRFYFERDASEKYRRDVYATATLLLLTLPFLVSAAAGCVVWLLAGQYLTSVPFFPYIFVMLLVGLFTPVIKLLGGLLRVQRRALTFIKFNVGFFVVQTATIVIALVLGYGLAGQVYSQLLANVLFAGVAVAVLARYSPPRLSRPLARRMLIFGIPLIPFFLFTWMESAAGRFMLEHYVNLTQVGIFALAAQFAGLLTLAAATVDNALLPHFLERAREENTARELGLLVSRYIAAFALAGLLVIVLAKPTILVMATPDYHDATHYVAPLTVAAWLFVATKPISWVMTQGHRTGLLSTLHGGSAVALVILLFLFLGPLQLGIAGAVLAPLLANLLTVVAGFWLARSSQRLVMPWWRLTAMLLVMIAGGVVLQWLEPPGIDLLRLALQALLLLGIALATVRLAGIDLGRLSAARNPNGHTYRRLR